MSWVQIKPLLPGHQWNGYQLHKTRYLQNCQILKFLMKTPNTELSGIKFIQIFFKNLLKLHIVQVKLWIMPKIVAKKHKNNNI